MDEYAVTDASGVATFSNILIGTGYTLEEVDTPIRYVVPDNQTAAIEWNKVTNKSCDNVLKKWNLTVTKQDVETGSAQGDANLAGAKYGIYKGDELIDTYVTDADGKFTTKYYICGNTHLTERCEAMLASLNSDLARPLEPSYDELNPPPEPEKEYRFSLGDTVYLGTHEYEVLSFDENEVVLYDTQFPLFNKTMTREEFEDRLKENPLNDHLLQVVEQTLPPDNTETRIA